MVNQPGEQNQQQSNAAPGTNDSYYNNQMQGTGFSVPMASPTFTAPSIQGLGNIPMPSQQFQQSQGMLQQAYSPQQIQANRDLLLQSARNANLAGLQGAQGQLAQMGMGSLGGQAGLLSGQYAQGALGEQQAVQQGQQMAQQMAQGYMAAQEQMRQQEADIGFQMNQSYQDTMDALNTDVRITDGNFVVDERLEQALQQYSMLLQQQVKAGVLDVGTAAMFLRAYPDNWSREHGIDIYRRRKGSQGRI